MNNSFKWVKLFSWIGALLIISSFIGISNDESVKTWYVNINKSPLTPPNYMFGIAWSILYVLIAISGWIIWEYKTTNNEVIIKSLYIIQLIFNWLWTPLFFRYQYIGLCFYILILIMTITAILIVLLCTSKSSYQKLSGLLLTPYLFWLMFATHLNFYILHHNNF